MISNISLFNLDGVWKFFDSNLEDTKVGEIISKLGKVDVVFVTNHLKKLYPKPFDIDYSENLMVPILDFKQKIDTSLKFC